MAKNYEFRPDKPQVSWISKLHLTQLQRQALLKWTLYALLLLALSLLPDVVLSRFRLFGATTDLIPCAIILICVELGAERSCLFALIAAMLYKFSGTAPGYYVIGLIPVLGVMAAAVRQSVFRKTISSTMLCACIAVILYEMGIFAFGLVFQSTALFRVTRFLVTAGLSLLTFPILYPITIAIEKIGEKTWKS